VNQAVSVFVLKAGVVFTLFDRRAVRGVGFWLDTQNIPTWGWLPRSRRGRRTVEPDTRADDPVNTSAPLSITVRKWYTHISDPVWKEW